MSCPKTRISPDVKVRASSLQEAFEEVFKMEQSRDAKKIFQDHKDSQTSALCNPEIPIEKFCSLNIDPDLAAIQTQYLLQPSKP